VRAARFVLALVVVAGVVALALGPVRAAPRAAPTDSLVAWWAMDESGGVRYDSTGISDLTDVNTVASSNTSKSGKSSLFVSANGESLQLGDNAETSMGDIDFTLVGWVRFDKINNFNRIIGKGADVPSAEFYLDYATNVNRFRFLVGNNSTYGMVTASNSGAAITDTWYFVAAWHDTTSNTINIQVNNGTIDSVSYSGGSWDSTNSLLFGSTGAGSQLDGLLDEFALYKKILSASELSNIYNSGAGCAYANLVNNCQSVTATPTPTHTPTPDFTSWPYPKAKNSSGFTENGGAQLNDLYQVNGTVFTWTEAAGAGAQWVQLNYTGIPAASLTLLHWELYGYYSGGHAVKAQCYSPGQNDWVSLTGDTTDLPTGSGITFYEIPVSLNDCVSSGAAQLRLLHSANGNGAHVLVFDQATLHGVAVATATPTLAPGTATNTPTITPTPTKTSTPDYVIQATLASGNVLQIERRVTFGEALIVIVVLALIVLTVLRFIYDATRVLG